MPCRIAIVALILVLLPAGLPAARVNRQAPSKPSPKAARYVCPMHSEVTSAKPASCSKCGMALRLVEKKIDAGPGPATESAALETSSLSSISSSRIPDIPVYDQHGNRKNFYTDLVKGKTVAINFIFTTCTTICPSLTATFRRVQQDLAKRALKVQLISISVDPATDTTERLRDFASRFRAGAGWTFVTGDQATMDSLLQALGAAVADKNDHTPMILIGNEATGYWTRANGLASPATLVKAIAEAARHK